MKKSLLCSLLALFALVLLTYDASARQTRDLVFDDDEEQEQSSLSTGKSGNFQVVALKSTIELKRNGEVSTVSPSYEFQSGDKVKLLYTPSIDGYAYWLTKGSSGALNILFPSAQAGADNKVARNQEYSVPVKGSFKFDNTPGKEELLCVISPNRISELDQVIAKNSKGVIPAQETSQVDDVVKKNESKRQTRDLVFDEDEEEEVVTKKQVAPKGEPLVTYFVLNHK